ncbi:hypothetical protein IFM89_032039 [Coptis chinensis]|uniref:Uncharacterized protein n=1 Tax=Coptis chinensis TaxID=261450 RepID=A0A835LK47_9MAGN|nr:hypothetical protein IFM89_032039 [Coptis chinensis]
MVRRWSFGLWVGMVSRGGRFGVFPVDEYYRDGVVLELKSGGKWREIENMWEEGERRRLGNVVVLDGEDGEEPGIFFMLDGADIFQLFGFPMNASYIMD